MITRILARARSSPSMLAHSNSTLQASPRLLSPTLRWVVAVPSMELTTKTRRPSRHDTQRRTFATSYGQPCKLNMDALIGISDTVLLYLLNANPGLELDALQKDSASFGTRWRKMTEILVKTQLHVIGPFGYPPDPTGMQNYTKEMTRVVSQLDHQRDTETIKDLQTSNKDIWGVLVKRAFGLTEVKWLPVEDARSLAMGITSYITNPMTLGKAEAISKRTDLTPEKKLDALHDEVLNPAYRSAMNLLAMSVKEESVVNACATIQVLGASDPVVAQTMQMGLSALMEKVPLLRGETK